MKRIGIITVTTEAQKTFDVRKFFPGAESIDTRRKPRIDAVEYRIIHDKFDPVPEGAAIPHYLVNAAGEVKKV